MPGSTCRRDDVEKSTGVSADKILSFPSVKIRLLYLPMISQQSLRTAEKPISSLVSNVSTATRSKPACFTSASFDPCKCFRRSIQNMGGAAGFSLGVSVNPMRGLFDPALMRSRFPPAVDRICRTISSLAGWNTFSILAPSAVFRISASVQASIPASNAISSLLF